MHIKFEKSDENQSVSQVEEKLLLLIHQDYFNMTNEFRFRIEYAILNHLYQCINVWNALIPHTVKIILNIC